MRFQRACLPGEGFDAVPRTKTGMPVDMAERAWGEDRYYPSPALTAPQQTGMHTSRPFIAFGRSYPGVQRKNGVAQLDVGYEVPAIPGSDVPYWQQTLRVNPPTFLRGGGSPYPPQGPYQLAGMYQAAGQTNINDIGPTYFTPAA